MQFIFVALHGVSVIRTKPMRSSILQKLSLG